MGGVRDNPWRGPVRPLVISGGELDRFFGDTPMMLAWEEDGRPLTGDRGPVRLVIPGDQRAAARPTA